MISTCTQIDTAAVLAAAHSEKVAIALAWREHFNPTVSQPQRDEWARAFFRQLMPYINTTVSN